MGPLDKVVSLPKIDAPTSDSLVNYKMPDLTTKVNEAYKAVVGKFGDTASLSKLYNSAPSFKSLGIASALGTLGSSSPFKSVASMLKPSASDNSASARAINQETGSASAPGNEDHKVQLVSTVDDLIVIFDVMPDVSESRAAEYEALQVAQMPGEFQKYRGTKSTTWQINATFVCRNSDEATQQRDYLNVLRSWVMPYFGEQVPDRSLLGAPPAVLNFSGWRGIVGTVPVVITSLNWTWPKECDWIPTNDLDENGRKIPFPTVMNVQIALVESFSAQQFNNFDLESFRDGSMIDAFGTQAVVRSDPSVAEATTSDTVSDQNNYYFDP
mgnify:CR=1 FL=1